MHVCKYEHIDKFVFLILRRKFRNKSGLLSSPWNFLIFKYRTKVVVVLLYGTLNLGLDLFN